MPKPCDNTTAMTKLSDTQRAILSAASHRPDRLVLPLPERLKGGAASKVIASLTANGLVEEVDAKPGQPVWRPTGDDHKVTLVATDAAFLALGIPQPTPAAPAAAPVRKTRADSKQARLIGMLKRQEGATVDEIIAALDWRSHTVRGAMAGALKKKLGLSVTSDKVEGRGRVYRIAT